MRSPPPPRRPPARLLPPPIQALPLPVERRGAALSPAQVHAECTQHLQLVRGDVLVLDNLRVAHGRTPWAGSDRQMGLLLSDLVPREAHRTPPKAFLQWAAEAHDEHVAQEVGHARAAATS